MGLQTLDANGNMSWHCHSGEHDPLTAHISHEQVEHVAPDVVRLPPCPHCKAHSQMHLKVAFTPEELRASNMVDKNGRPTASYAMAQRHIQLKQQLEAAGKGYREPQAVEQDATQAIDEQEVLRLFQKLGYTARSLAEVAALIEQAQAAKG